MLSFYEISSTIFLKVLSSLKTSLTIKSSSLSKVFQKRLAGIDLIQGRTLEDAESFFP